MRDSRPLHFPIMLVAAAPASSCSSDQGGAPAECSGRSFYYEAVLPEVCLDDGGIRGDCAAGTCLPDRDWDSTGSLTCSVRWWVPREPGHGETLGGCDSRPFLQRMGEVDEFDRELCSVPTTTPGLYLPPESEAARSSCSAPAGGLISASPNELPAPAGTLITVTCWSDTCDDRDAGTSANPDAA